MKHSFYFFIWLICIFYLVNLSSFFFYWFFFFNSKVGRQPFSRICKSCKESLGDLIDCRAEDPVLCGFDKDGYKQTKFIACQTSGYDCYGNGAFTGEWSNWKLISICPNTCKNQKKKYIRDCNMTWKTNNSSFKCPGVIGKVKVSKR